MKICLFFIGMLLVSLTAAGQQEQQYVSESDSLVLSKLEQWQDLKFGLLMHWGPYSQWGVVESWSICGEDEVWCRRKNPDYSRYIQEYENLKTTFNPVKFNPSDWSKAAWDAGMRYVIFTTKHHDGFCMFDTKYTNYKITDKDCPFHVNPKANIAGEIFDAFRNQGLWTGAYFSKPDWHSDYYWWRNFPTPDRNANYDISKYPDRWEKFVQYTHNQVNELLTEYGSMDILWLDGGWVLKRSLEDIKKQVNSPEYKFTREQSQDIRMEELVQKARSKQPGIIVVDRAVPGRNQNYLTPENHVPDNMLPYPWESCITSTKDWSWVPNAKYKSSREVVHLLADIVCKGGNLLLNIAPGPDGKWDDGAYAMLEGVGKWIRTYGEAVYHTRANPPYRDGDICYTRQSGTTTVFGIYLIRQGVTEIPGEISLLLDNPAAVKDVTMVGANTKLTWKINKSGVTVFLSPDQRKKLAKELALPFKVVF